MNILVKLSIIAICLGIQLCVNCMKLAKPTFSSQHQYLEHLRSISQLPRGFSIGTTRFLFRPFEVDKLLPMNVTLIVTDEPTDSFAAMFTSNLFPGGPIYVGRERLRSSSHLQAIVVNNKISNVCPGGAMDFGASASEHICDVVSSKLKLGAKSMVFPSSTGIIGEKFGRPSSCCCSIFTSFL